MPNNNKNNTIRRKLLLRGRVILGLILLLIIASQLVVGILKKTSNEFFIEYNEMSAVQEFKLSLYQVLLQTNKYTLIDNPDDQAFFMILIHQAHEKLESCQQIITESHDSRIIDEFPARLNKIENLAKVYFKIIVNENNINQKNILKRMNEEITEGLSQLDIVLIETKFETLEYYEINKTVFKHSSLAILSLGLVILLIFLIGGFRFVNNLTKPIHNFVETTKKITRGERGIKIKIDTGDEFNTLAESFNLMLDSLENTTVSKTYLDNILENMFDSLIVTDNNLIIRSVNESASKLIGQSKSWLEGKSLSNLFGSPTVFNFEENELESVKNQVEKINFFTNKDGENIPALISCAILKDNNQKEIGLVLVGHDLTIKKEIEQKLEHSRKQRQIDINEAQEVERMRIATELHDGLGQMLTAVSYSTEEFQNISDLNKNETEELIAKIQDQISIAIRESKNLAHNLIPIVLKDFGLVVAIQNLIDKVRELYNINIIFNTYDFNERIDVKLEKTLYRICQESLNNIIKHSKAKNVNYQLFKQDNLIVLVIDDDGIGFDLDSYENKRDKGVGLISMKDRVLSFEGTITIDSQPGIGTEILIEIPFKSV